MSEVLSSTTKKVVWKICNITKDLFSGEKTNGMKNTKHFMVTNKEHYTEWYLRFKAVKGDFEFFLMLADCSTNDFKIVADFVFSKSGGRVKRSYQIPGKEFTAETVWGKGWTSFVGNRMLMESFDEFVVDGTLTLSCEMTVHLLQPKEQKFFEPSNQVFFATYKNLLQNETLCDFKIESKDGKIFKVHKFALIVKSQVFKTMLTSNKKEVWEGICKIKEFDSKTVEAMLKHIYFEEIPDFDEIARKLIYAAEKYDLKELKNLCINSMIRNLKEENVVEALKISEEISKSDALYKKCVALVLINWDRITKTEEWKKMPNEILKKLNESQVQARIQTIEFTTED